MIAFIYLIEAKPSVRSSGELRYGLEENRKSPSHIHIFIKTKGARKKRKKTSREESTYIHARQAILPKQANGHLRLFPVLNPYIRHSRIGKELYDLTSRYRNLSSSSRHRWRR